MEGMQEAYCVLEVNLISAQDLKVPSAGNHHPPEIYAVVWAEDKSKKLRSRIDSSGSGQNPTWNDKFLFRVSPEFAASTTAAVSVEIYAVRRYLKDSLVGSARCLINTGKFINSVHVHRPSGSFHGILNIAAAVRDGADDQFFKGSGSSSMNFQELTKNDKQKKIETPGFFGTLRLVKSSTSISTMASLLLPQNEKESPLRKVKSEPNISTILTTYAKIILDPNI